MTKREEAEVLAKEFSTPSRGLQAIQQGDKIVEPLLFSNEAYFHRFNELKLQKAIRPLLKSAVESKTAFQFDEIVKEACQDLGLDYEWAKKYFESVRYKRWAADRVQEIEAHLGLSVEYVAGKHRDNIDGTISLRSSQLESLKEVGDRIWPKVSKIEHEISQKEATTLDELPDYTKKVDELEARLKASLPAGSADAA